MPIVVMKFGGTSVGSVERISAVADRVVHAREAGNDVDRRRQRDGDTTDELLAMAARDHRRARPARAGHAAHGGRAHRDVAARYRLERAGVPGRQLHGIAGRDHHRHAARPAKIIEITARADPRGARPGNVVILAGFQGVSSDYEMTTLGRGGSDITAVAMAGALGADVCEIYTDVDGVYTADPRIVPGARKVDTIGYDEMLELAAAGAQGAAAAIGGDRAAPRRPDPRALVVHGRARHVGTRGGADMEEVIDLAGSRIDTDEAKVTIDDVPDRPGVAAAMFEAIADDDINVDMIVQNVVARRRRPTCRSRRPHADLPRLSGALDALAREIGAARFSRRRRHREGVARGRRDEDPSGRRRRHVRRARRRGDQHRDDLDLADPYLVRDPRGRRRPRRARGPRAVRPRRPRSVELVSA